MKSSSPKVSLRSLCSSYFPLLPGWFGLKNGDTAVRKALFARREVISQLTLTEIDASTRQTMKNFLTVDQYEFKDSLKIFMKGWAPKGNVLLCFEGGYLSIEAGDRTAVMRAEGEWHGRATFRPRILQALAHVPPTMNPIPISYAENHLLIGGMSVRCEWVLQGQSMIHDFEDPSLLDLVVLDRYIPRSELGATERGRKIKSAVRILANRIALASKALKDFGVSEDELRELTNRKIGERITALGG